MFQKWVWEGHGFSRAAKAHNARALAPEGRLADPRQTFLKQAVVLLVIRAQCTFVVPRA